MSRPIYLDYMATTPVDPAVVEEMQKCLTISGAFGNPASQTHYFGCEAESLIQQASEQVAALIHADPKEIIWTSGATEADNLAIKGAVEFYQRKGKHIITMTTEHKAVLDTCKYLATQGYDITWLDPKPNGLLDLSKLENAIRNDTILLSVMHVNNETGVIQDLSAIGDIAKKQGVLFHVDAAQSVGKVPINLAQLSVDLMSFSGHKLYGPKGIGALYVRQNPRIRLMPQIHGGGHQKGLRSGTLPTHQIVGMGKAFVLAQEKMMEEQNGIRFLREKLWEGISSLGGVHLHGDVVHRIAGCLNVGFDGVDSQSLLLSLQDIALSSGSACNSASPTPSHVLLALGLSSEEANRAIRFSLGRFTTEQEIADTIALVVEQVKRLRQISPLWDHSK